MLAKIVYSYIVSTCNIKDGVIGVFSSLIAFLVNLSPAWKSLLVLIISRRYLPSIKVGLLVFLH